MILFFLKKKLVISIICRHYSGRGGGDAFDSIKRVEAVFALLAKISGNHDFEDLIEKYRSKENVTMADAFEPIREVFRAEGWKLGVDEGRRLGVDEGRKLGMEDVARNLIAMHVLSRGDIAKATGLAIDEVRALEEAHCAR